MLREESKGSSVTVYLQPVCDIPMPFLHKKTVKILDLEVLGMRIGDLMEDDNATSMSGDGYHEGCPEAYQAVQEWVAENSTLLLLEYLEACASRKEAPYKCKLIVEKSERSHIYLEGV